MAIFTIHVHETMNYIHNSPAASFTTHMHKDNEIALKTH